MSIRIGITGAAGRMGRMLAEVVSEAERPCSLVVAIERAESSLLGADVGELLGEGASGVIITADLASVVSDIDVLIDFTVPEATLHHAALCVEQGVPMVIGTTGFSAEQENLIEAAARHATIVKSGNMSLGVNLLAGLVETAAAALGSDWDIEILDMHHRHKIDAPSGTALLLGEAAAKGRNIDLNENRESGRDGISEPRKDGAIGFAALRGGSVVGDHEVIFASEGEQIRLVHRAESRDIFASGALKAALWAQGQSSGLYSMRDVLGLTPKTT